MNVLQINAKKCYGCELCMHVCPVQAITMKPDEYGFIYPSVNDRCIDCGKCVRECVVNEEQNRLNAPILTFAAVRSEEDKIEKSSSGGVFAAIAEAVLDTGDWLVTGCSLNEAFHPVQMMIKDSIHLDKLLGSKYVQCRMGDIYEEVRSEIEKGKKVLFSGTPCEVAAIKRYINSPNLYTIEVICHGVANEEMLMSYLDTLEMKEANQFVFRDKKQGWSFNNRINYSNGKSKKINHRLSSYMTYYLDGETYRDSCYNCMFACELRGADITIGDFWGIIKKRPELSKKIDIKKGVSCLLVNSAKGKELCDYASLNCYHADYNDIKDGNEPLNHPSVYTTKRKVILGIWGKNRDWSEVDAYWKKNDYKWVYKIWSLMPINFQHFIRTLLNMR